MASRQLELRGTLCHLSLSSVLPFSASIQLPSFPFTQLSLDCEHLFLETSKYLIGTYFVFLFHILSFLIHVSGYEIIAEEKSQ